MRRLLQLKHPLLLLVWPLLSCLALAELARTTSELGAARGESSAGESEGADSRLAGAATSRSMSAMSSRRKAPKSKSPSEGAATVRSGSMAAAWPPVTALNL